VKDAGYFDANETNTVVVSKSQCIMPSGATGSATGSDPVGSKFDPWGGSVVIEYGHLAQSVERAPEKRQVVGSIPAVTTSEPGPLGSRGGPVRQRLCRSVPSGPSPRTEAWGSSSAWLEQSSDTRQVGGSNPPGPTGAKYGTAIPAVEIRRSVMCV
jgi:hypothetical protein